MRIRSLGRRWWSEFSRGSEFDIHHFDTLPAAKEAAAKQQFDVFVCDGNVLGEDGAAWAEELHEQGHAVMILASAGRGKIPFLCKGAFGTGERFIAMMRSIVAARPRRS